MRSLCVGVYKSNLLVSVKHIFNWVCSVDCVVTVAASYYIYLTNKFKNRDYLLTVYTVSLFNFLAFDFMVQVSKLLSVEHSISNHY